MTTVDEAPRVADLTDLELVELTQGGYRDAVGELWLRHYPSTLRTASGVTRQAGDAEEITSEAFTAMMSACLNGHGPTTSVRAYLSTSVRNIAAKRATGPKSAEVPSDDPTRYEDADRLDPDAVARRAELGLVREAFSSLPDRWQTVLWRTAVDHDSHDRVAEAMGLSRNGVAALAVRARRALKVAYLQAHVSRGAVDDDCRPFLDQLAALSQGSAPGRQLQDHLDGCRRCGERLSELALVEQNVAGFMLPAVAILIPAAHDLTAAGGIIAASATASGAGASTGGAISAGGATPTAGGLGGVTAAPASSRADSLGPARRARQVRNASIAAAIAVLLASAAFALSRPDATPAALELTPDVQGSGADAQANPATSDPPAGPIPDPPVIPEPTPPVVLPFNNLPGGGASTGSGGTAAAPVGTPSSPAASSTPALTQSPTPTPTTPNATPTPTPTPSTPSTAVPLIYAPATLGLSMSGSGTTVTIRPSATTGSPTGDLRLRLTVPAGVTLSGSTGAWIGCTQSGTTITCLTAATAATTFTGTVNTTWPAGIAGTCTATVSGTTSGGAPLSASLGAPWPLLG